MRLDAERLAQAARPAPIHRLRGESPQIDAAHAVNEARRHFRARFRRQIHRGAGENHNRIGLQRQIAMAGLKVGDQRNPRPPRRKMRGLRARRGADMNQFDALANHQPLQPPPMSIAFHGLKSPPRRAGKPRHAPAIR